MAIDKVREFYTDKAMVAQITESFKNSLREETIRRVFRGENVIGLKEARDVFHKWLRDLDGIYAEKDIKKPKEFSESE